MGTANGAFKLVAYKVEATYGNPPAAAAAQLLRRAESTLDLNKDTFESEEQRPDMQDADFRHGLRKVGGAINCDLSPKTFADFMAAVLRKDFTAGASATNQSITVGGVAGAWTLTRAAGSYLTDGVKVGDVVCLTAGAFNAANLNKNIMLTGVTATVATGFVLNGTALVAEGPIATATLAVKGKKSLVPLTGHTDKSFTIEHWYPDVPSNELFTGNKVSKVSINLPATGMAKISIEFVGKDGVPGVAQYFTAPSAVTTTGALAAVNGAIVHAGAKIATITGMSIDITCDQSGEPTAGSNTVNALAAGKVKVTGQFTALFDSNVLRDNFYNETESNIYAALTCDNTAASDFLTFCMSRIKTNGASKDDGAKSLVQTIPFKALLNVNGGAALANDATTISIQDSAA